MPAGRALKTLSEALLGDAIVSTDVGSIGSTAAAYRGFDRPRSFLVWVGWGNCGYALRTAMGATIAAPGRPVITRVDDRAWVGTYFARSS